MTGDLVTSSMVKGWCPGAHRPMVSGDGLVLRVRPYRNSLSLTQARSLCDIAKRYGSGMLDLTSRGNLQIRGVTEAGHPPLLDELAELGLLDADPKLEGRRNLLMAPNWRSGDQTDRLHQLLIEALPQLPPMPEKMGFAIDTGGREYLSSGSADFRFERTEGGELLLRADGVPKGLEITEATAISALNDMAEWFVKTGGPAAGRMTRHVSAVSLPYEWRTTAPRAPATPLNPGPQAEGLIIGAPFGNFTAEALEVALNGAGVTELRLMTGRMLWLRGATSTDAPGFVSTSDTALLSVHACPGAPFCQQASVKTRELATRLAGTSPGAIHVSGCAKGCAWPRRADITIVGRNGRLDIVRNGAPWDEPIASGLGPDDLHDLTGFA